MTTPIDIGPATLESVRSDLIVVRFKPGTIASPSAFAASMQARKKHFSGTPHVVVLVAPDDADFDPEILRKNQYKDQGMEGFTLALAFVSTDVKFTNVLELYYALHPAPFPVKFFNSVEEALPWAEVQATHRARKG